MNDDIVTRLRKEWANCPTCIASKEAADEIERLRASVLNTFDNGFDEIERLRTELADWRRVAETEHIRFTNELKTVHGE